MSEADELREHAERCRRLARSATDPNVARILLGLAEEYLARARGLERRTTLPKAPEALPKAPEAGSQQPAQQQQQIQPKPEEKE